MNDIEPRHRHPLHSTAAVLEAALKDLGEVKAKTSPPAAEGFSGKLRPIIVYGLSDTRTACQAALEQGRQELAMMSPTGVAHSLGPQWMKELIANTANMFSDLEIIGILDCGPYEGHVMNALRNGIKHVHFTGDTEVAAKLDMIAAKAGAVVHRSFAEVLDLKNESDPTTACREWFKVVIPSNARKKV